MAGTSGPEKKVYPYEGMIPGFEVDETQEAFANEFLEKRIAERSAETRSTGYYPSTSGLKPGDEGEDVVRLQKYLARFGYLASAITEEFGAPKDVVPGSPADGNVRREHPCGPPSLPGVLQASGDGRARRGDLGLDVPTALRQSGRHAEPSRPLRTEVG